MNKIILIAGASGTGKTSVAEALGKKGLQPLKSYTTRPKRKPDDSDHVYIDRDEFQSLEEDMVAKTDFHGNLYGATVQQVEESDIYVIDMDGIGYFLNKYKGKKSPVVFYLTADENTRFCRMIERGDGYEAVKSRIENDREAFSDEHIKECCPGYIEIDSSVLTPAQIAELILRKAGFQRTLQIPKASIVSFDEIKEVIEDAS